MRIGIETGYLEDFWKGWPWTPMCGGSEHLVVELAKEFAALGHTVTVRLPRDQDERVWENIRWLSHSARGESYDVLFSFDGFDLRGKGDKSILVACRSDPPVHTNFDRMVFLSRHHARLMGHPDSPSIGGGVRLSDYPLTKRVAGRVLCTSSPDRCSMAFPIGEMFPGFIATYRPVPGLPKTRELSRADLIQLQRTAMVTMYPLDPVRPSDFFSMAVCESLAAGTPVVVSDADSMKELWGGCTVMIPRPIHIAEWVEAIERLLYDKKHWASYSLLGRAVAQQHSWPVVAKRYLDVATA